MPTAATIAPSPDLLTTVMRNGAEHASRALSKWLRKGVRVGSDGLTAVKLADAGARFGEPDQAVVAVHMPLAGTCSGHLLLIFPPDVALALVDLLMEQPEGTSSSFGELETSCLQETCNIVGSAYMNCLSKWLDMSIEPGAPVLVHDMVCAVVEPVLAEHAVHSDEVFLASTEFLLDGRRLEWSMMLLPSPETLAGMRRRFHTDAVQEAALHTIAENGADQASRAASKWLKRGVHITTDGFARTSLVDAILAFRASQPIVGIRFQLTGRFQAHALLAIPEADAPKIVDLVFGQPIGSTTEIDEVAESCLKETGNIIVGGFVNALAAALGFGIIPGPPDFKVDLPEAVVKSVLVGQLGTGDEVFHARTDFTVDGQSVEWSLLLSPTASSIRMIESTVS